MPPSPPLNAESIRSTLATRSLGQRIELYSQLGSTNREAAALAQAGVEHGTLVLADSQTEGRGRLSRPWYSPPGINVYCSIVIRTTVAEARLADWLSWLPLMAALAAAEAIESVAGSRVAVKWPNDLLIDNRKVGGILCESGTGSPGGSFQIVGIGLNVNGRRSQLPADLIEFATTIREETRQETDRNVLLSRLLLELETCLEAQLSGRSSGIRMAYQQRCSTIGKTVKVVQTEGHEWVGLAESIALDGSLTVSERPLPAPGRSPVVRQVRVADIVHLKT